jgi:hypothetical protein
MPRVDLNHDGELFEPVAPPIREIMAAHPPKRKSRLWRWLTHPFLPLTSLVGLEVAVLLVGPVLMVLVIALFSFRPF